MGTAHPYRYLINPFEEVKLFVAQPRQTSAVPAFNIILTYQRHRPEAENKGEQVKILLHCFDIRERNLFQFLPAI